MRDTTLTMSHDIFPGAARSPPVARVILRRDTLESRLI